jgi:hypothetical protein
MYEADIAVSVISYKRRWVRIASFIFFNLLFSQFTAQPAGITVALKNTLFFHNVNVA